MIIHSPEFLLFNLDDERDRVPESLSDFVNRLKKQAMNYN